MRVVHIYIEVLDPSNTGAFSPNKKQKHPQELHGDAGRLYEMDTRHFIATLSHDARCVFGCLCIYVCERDWPALAAAAAAAAAVVVVGRKQIVRTKPTKPTKPTNRPNTHINNNRFLATKVALSSPCSEKFSLSGRIMIDPGFLAVLLAGTVKSRFCGVG